MIELIHPYFRIIKIIFTSAGIDELTGKYFEDEYKATDFQDNKIISISNNAGEYNSYLSGCAENDTFKLNK